MTAHIPLTSRHIAWTMFSISSGLAIALTASYGISLSLFAAVIGCVALWGMALLAAQGPSGAARRLTLPYKLLLRHALRASRKVTPASDAKRTRRTGSRLDKISWYLAIQARDPADKERLARQNWSWASLDLSILLAFICPITFALGQFLLSKTSVTLGGVDLIPANTPVWMAACSLGAIALTVASCALPLEGTHAALARLRAAISGFGVIGAFALMGVSIYLVVEHDIGSPAVQLAVFLVLVCVNVAAIGAGGTYILTFSFAASFGYLLVTWLLAIAALAWSTRKGFGAGLYLLILCASVSGAAMSLTEEGTDPLRVPLLILAVILPLTLAVAVWLSYGSTLWLLSMGRRQAVGRRCLLGVADLVISALIALALPCLWIVVFGVAGVLSPETDLDLAGLLQEFGESPWRSLWLIALCAVPLVPTLIHGAIACFDLITCMPRRVMRRPRAAKARHGTGSRLTAPLRTAALTFICAALPVCLITLSLQLIWRSGDALRAGYVTLLQAIGTGAGVL